MYLYEIEYRNLDELMDGNEPHNAYVVVYDSGTIEGETFAYALDKANEDSDFTGVDKILTKTFELKDDDICFYYDINDIADEATKWGKLVPELQKSFNIFITDIDYIQGE